MNDLGKQLNVISKIFGPGKNKYSVNQIVHRVLLNDRSVTVIVPSDSSSTITDVFDETEHYKLILSKIILRIQDRLDRPYGEFVNVKNYNCALIFDEAQNISI